MIQSMFLTVDADIFHSAIGVESCFVSLEMICEEYKIIRFENTIEINRLLIIK